MNQIELNELNAMSIADKAKRIDDFIYFLRNERFSLYNILIPFPEMQNFIKTKIFIAHKDQSTIPLFILISL